eukprot:13466295-Alexandrium_andersonii.AAC.1
MLSYSTWLQRQRDWPCCGCFQKESCQAWAGSPSCGAARCGLPLVLRQLCCASGFRAPARQALG